MFLVQAGKLTTKNSCARNLYRLLAGISFISQLLQNLARNRHKPLRQAASEAYDATLSAMHGYMVRMAIKTSMYMLPTREAFLTSINETGAQIPKIPQKLARWKSFGYGSGACIREARMHMGFWKDMEDDSCTFMPAKRMGPQGFES